MELPKVGANEGPDIINIGFEIGPSAAKRLGNENLKMQWNGHQFLGFPQIGDRVTFFIFGKDYEFLVFFRRWYVDQDGKASLTFGIDLEE